MTRTSHRLQLAAVLVASVALLGACSDDKATSTTPTGELKVSTPWARTSPAMASAGAAYMEITNTTDTDDALVSASVDPSIAGKVEIHETTTDPEKSMSSTTMEGSMSSTTMDGAMSSTTTTGGSPMMRMVPVDRIPLAKGKTVSLKPGGYHVMLLQLSKPLVVGEKLELTLTFEHAAAQRVMAEVRDTAP